MRRIITLFAAVAGIGHASHAAASPAAEPQCTSSIVTPTGGSSALFSEDCQTIYVAPPEVAKAHVSAVSPRQNLGFCTGLSSANKAANTTFRSAATLAVRIETMIASFDPLNARIANYENEVRRATLAFNVAQAHLDTAFEERTQLEQEVGQALQAVNACLLTTKKPLECKQLDDELEAKRSELRDFMQWIFLPAQSEVNRLEARLVSFEGALARESSRYLRAIQPLIELQNSLFNLNATVFAVYQQYARLAGAAATLSYSTEWAPLLRAYESSNPGKSIARLPIKNTKLSAGVAVEDAQTDVPGVLSFSIPGVLGDRNFVSLPTGGQLPGLTAPTDPATRYEGVFGEGIGAQMVVSLMAACPLYPDGLAGGLKGDANQLAANLALNVHYTYDVTARRGYTARYNMSQWLKRVEQGAKKGGLVSAKTLHDVHESTSSNDWFEIKFDASEAEFQYSPDEQARITSEVKGQLMERGLRRLALQLSLLRGDTTQPLTLAPSGAGRAAAYLIANCGGWSWCRVGGWALGVLDSWFGRSDATQSFQRSNDLWVTDQVRGVAILTRSGSLTFQPPQ